MAIMIPETPHIFEPASQEGLMFDALTLLPDDYYVFTRFGFQRYRIILFMRVRRILLFFIKSMA